jgi:hypothetical protein
MRLSLVFDLKQKILPIFHLTKYSKVLFYAHTAHLCAKLFGSQEINVDARHKGAPMSTHREIGPCHASQSKNKDKNRVFMTDTFKAHARFKKHINT